MRVVFAVIAALLLLPTIGHADPILHGTAKVGNCSGSLFRFDGQSMDDDALVLTNGHCIRLLEAQEVLVDQPSQIPVTFFGPDGEPSEVYRTKDLVYATMYRTDLAVYRMAVSYRALADAIGIDPFVLSRQGPSAGDDILVISGYHETSYSCTLEQVIPLLREGTWDFHESLRYSAECQTIDGFSGWSSTRPATRSWRCTTRDTRGLALRAVWRTRAKSPTTALF